MRNRNWRRMAILLGLSLGVTGSLCTGCGSAVSGTVKNYNEVNTDADVLSASGDEVLAVRADISGKSYGGSAEDFIMGDQVSAWRGEKARWGEN
ncbi:MAG: hypothetical protein IJ733_18850, partial [Lachnospiraceae bacterium]|nr:hypothetical protein [Lachnospiraceae bacterium]